MKTKIFLTAFILLFAFGACKTHSKSGAVGATADTGSTSAKVQAQVKLIESYWKLIELNGNAVETKEGGKEAHIILREEGNRVNGNGGCNNLMGTYSIDGEKIKFSQMAMSMMACAGMDKESEFTQALGKVEKYTLTGKNLIFFDVDSKSLAKFEVVYQN